MTELSHRPVMLEEVLAGLNLRANGVYIDGTFGRGGHSLAILEHLGEDGRLIAIDKDPQAVVMAEQTAARDARLQIQRGTFAMLGQIAAKLDLQGKVDGILLDLGVSSPQLDDAERGFSFRFEGPLDMRMDPTSGESAAEWLNRATAEEIATVLWEFGEERFSRRIAATIIRARPVSTTLELAELISSAVPFKEKNKHPATRSFQAIRIYLNGELEQLDAALEASLRVLNPAGRLAVISFHSLEDRRVKRFIRAQSQQAGGRRVPAPERVLALKRIGGARKPTAAEISLNPRARSAVLRVAERLPEPRLGGVR